MKRCSTRVKRRRNYCDEWGFSRETLMFLSVAGDLGIASTVTRRRQRDRSNASAKLASNRTRFALINPW